MRPFNEISGVVNPGRLRRILAKMLEENEFLSPYGIRLFSKFHEQHPYVFDVHGQEYRVDYLPAESNTGMFGGNSNWRGPVWMPVNALIIRALLSFYLFYGDKSKIECPAGSGKMMNLFEVSKRLSDRLTRIFLRDERGQRPVNGGTEKFQTDPHWRDQILFYEYSHGDNGAGLGASHQTGWTGVVAKLFNFSDRSIRRSPLRLAGRPLSPPVATRENESATHPPLALSRFDSPSDCDRRAVGDIAVRGLGVYTDWRSLHILASFLAGLGRAVPRARQDAIHYAANGRYIPRRARRRERSSCRQAAFLVGARVSIGRPAWVTPQRYRLSTQPCSGRDSSRRDRSVSDLPHGPSRRCAIVRTRADRLSLCDSTRLDQSHIRITVAKSARRRSVRRCKAAVKSTCPITRCGTLSRNDAGAKIAWQGLLLAVQSRIRLTRSFDRRSHNYLDTP